MANLMRRIASGAGVGLRTTWPAISLDAAISQWMEYMGNVYPTMGSGTLQQAGEEIPTDYRGMIGSAYKGNGVVFAVMVTRMMLFSEPRFQWQAIDRGRPGKLFGNPDLAIVEHPWPNGTTRDLLTRSIQSADLEGNFFAVRDRDQIRRLRPDWTTIVLGSRMMDKTPGIAPDAEVIGYVYHPGGRNAGNPPVTFLPEQVMHWAPIPDPEAHFRGMSWLTPIVREVLADSAATTHKLKFFQNGATPNLVVKLDASILRDEWEEWVDAFMEEHEGLGNAYRTIYLGGGADVTVVGSDMRQIDFKVTQGAGETRICAAGRVPPIIVGLSEGLQSATYSNYTQALRSFGDITMRPLWGGFAGALESILPRPNGGPARLWYDDYGVAFLQSDVKDTAEIQGIQAAAIKSLVDAGFESSSVIDAVTSNDLSKLIHTGLFSVQLQEPGAAGAPGPKLGSPLGTDIVPAKASAELPAAAMRAVLEAFVPA